jgi:hypothetical protein
MNLKRIIAAPFIWLLGLILFLEDWLWHPLLNFLRGFKRWAWVRWLEGKTAQLPPYAALLCFGIPMLVLFPFKFFGLYLIAQGFKLAGLGIFIVAKVVGTGAAAWVYSLTEPALSKLDWFAALRARFFRLKGMIYELIKTSVSYRFIRRRLSATRTWTRSKLALLLNKPRH